MPRTAPKDVDSYIAGFSEDMQRLMQRIRATIKKAVPGAEERISYQIPTYTLNGRSVYFAGFKAHIGMYPVTAEVTAKLSKQLATYRSPGAKATVRLPLSKPMPYALIGRIVKLKLRAGTARSATAPARRRPVRR